MDNLDIGFDNPEDAIEEVQDTPTPSFPSLCVRNAFQAASAEDDDDDDDSNMDEGEIPLEDPEEPGDRTSDSGIVDWETLEIELASMDMSGQGYAVDAAEIGVTSCFSPLIIIN
jgi:hypothetical protein